MFTDTDEASIQSDAYIEALLGGHARLPITLTTTAGVGPPEAGVRHVIRLLERGLPRFHPSFLFEEQLAAQLRAAARNAGDEDALGENAAGGLAGPVAGVGAGEQPLFLDRRLLIGGAFASGVSLAGAAMLAWRRGRD